MPDRELYARHDGLGINQNQCVLVVGCGGIGSWLGYFLGLAGVQRLHLFDGDKIEEHNLSRLPFTPKDIGRYKSEALADLISRSRPDVEVTAHAHFDAEFEGDALTTADWVVCSTDSHKSRKMVYDAVVNLRHKNDFGHGPEYLECGADGHSGSVTGAPAEWVTEAESQPGYQSVPVWVGPCVVVAGLASYYILHNTDIMVTHRVDWHEDNRGCDEGAYVKLDTFSEGEVADGTQVEGEAVERGSR
jgi:molybdopterin/thiamine biosynthesis adenylyltransferase